MKIFLVRCDVLQQRELRLWRPDRPAVGERRRSAAAASSASSSLVFDASPSLQRVRPEADVADGERADGRVPGGDGAHAAATGDRDVLKIEF